MMDLTLWGLFAAGFLSSTLLPGGSEVLLLANAYQQTHPLAVLAGVATAGNTLGGICTWALGWLVAARYPSDDLVRPRHRRALAWMRRYGAVALLLSWLPVLGDPLCLAAGWMRTRPWPSFLFMAVGKAVRYVTLLWLFGVATAGG